MLKGFGNVGEKMLNKMFRKVDDAVWDLMTGRVGISTNDGIATLEGEGDDAQVTVNVFDDFGMPIPAFAQNTPVDQIKQGDLIYNARKVMGWVIEVPEEGKVTFKLLKPDGTRGEWRPPKTNSIGIDINGAMVLRSLLNTVPGGDLGGLQGMLMPMLLMNDGDLGGMDMEKMLPLMLMGQMGTAGGGAAGGNNMMQAMMMMQMLKSGNEKGRKSEEESYFASARS
jgi:hypothetical protein